MREGDRHADGDTCRQEADRQADRQSGRLVDRKSQAGRWGCMLAEAARQVGRPAFRKETQAGRWGFMQAGSRHRQAGR